MKTDNERMEKLKDDLSTFVSRAAGKEATPEEVAALPEVARLLAEILRMLC